MANKSESIEERMERKRVAFDKRVAESKEAIKEHRNSDELAESLSNCLPITYEDSLLLIDMIMKGNNVLNKVGESANHAGKRMGQQLVKLNIDVSDSLTGLKAVQREAKKTARALREVEGMSPKDAILRFTDDEIFEVLSSRGWDIET